MATRKGFNPAEAEEWFKSIKSTPSLVAVRSFNPAEAEEWFKSSSYCSLNLGLDRFNPAEAEEWFKSLKTGCLRIVRLLFQSSRSRRMV